MHLPIYDAAFLPFGYGSMFIYGDENKGRTPRHFTWFQADRNVEYEYVFVTDTYIKRYDEVNAKKKIAWALEPYPFRDNVEWLYNNEDKYDYIFTHDKRFMREGGKWLWTPTGGSMIPIERWGIKPKTKLISMIVSQKNAASGHKIRHELANKIDRTKVDLLGDGYGERISKYNGIADYAFTIIVEGEIIEDFFTEKIIDAFSVGTIPIYMGASNISEYFDRNGIIQYTNIHELNDIINNVNFRTYKANMDNIIKNFNEAYKYYCQEDWMFNNYTDLFMEIERCHHQ